MFSGKCFFWHGCCWAKQDHIPWTAKEEGAPLCDFQDRWEEKRGFGWKNWGPSWELWWFHCFFAREWLSICSLWLWLCDFWELPEEQDIFYCMVSLFCKCSILCYSMGKQAAIALIKQWFMPFYLKLRLMRWSHQSYLFQSIPRFTFVGKKISARTITFCYITSFLKKNYKWEGDVDKWK